MPVSAPVIPFASYKWRWAALTPSEGLNILPVYLGVLRAFNRHDGQRTSDPNLLTDLQIVRQQTGTSIDLARTGERNLLRNSGQYWKMFGLIQETPGMVKMTTRGRNLAIGAISPAQFAADLVVNFSLPSPVYSNSEKADWHNAGLTIKPLRLILEVINELQLHGEGWITNEELARIVVPLASTQVSIATYVDAIIEFRRGTLALLNWPDCTPSANDKRITSEYLIFLSQYGYLTMGSGQRDTKRYLLMPNTSSLLIQLPQSVSVSTIQTVTKEVERQRRLVEVTARPQQRRFRQAVLQSCNNQCIVTGTQVVDVLEAAHIKPVWCKGSDGRENGLCLRTDIHTLFDSGGLKIDANGGITLSTIVSGDRDYARLPRQISLPAHIDTALLDWRQKYL
jgi:hypothetical protein